MKTAVYILIIWNLFVFLLYGFDKRKAKTGSRRISEKNLLLCALLMGGAGAALGMGLFRHKTRHAKFVILVPLALILNVLAIYAYYRYIL